LIASFVRSFLGADATYFWMSFRAARQPDHQMPRYQTKITRQFPLKKKALLGFEKIATVNHHYVNYLKRLQMRRYRHDTRVGPVYILPNKARWDIVFNSENLGSYHSPEAAADDAAGGHTFTPSGGISLDQLNLSFDLVNWERF